MAQRKTISGRVLAEHSQTIDLKLRTVVPTKWVAIDLETGDMWVGTATGNWERATSDVRSQVGMVAQQK